MPDIVPLQTLRPDMPYIAAARDTLVSQIAAIDVWAVFLPMPDRAHEHHQMRIAAKRLRYSLDLFRAILPDTVLECIGDLKDLQTELGTLHDIDTLFLSIEDAMIHDSLPQGTKRYEVKRARQAQQRTSLETLLSVTAAERDVCHLRCVELWQALTARQAFAPLHTALHALALLPESAPMTQEGTRAGENRHEH